MLLCTLYMGVYVCNIVYVSVCVCMYYYVCTDHVCAYTTYKNVLVHFYCYLLFAILLTVFKDFLTGHLADSCAYW